MDEHDAEAVIRRVLSHIAPEADLDDLGEDDDLQEALDLDSMDFLNFVIALKEETAVDIPESEYPGVRTVAGCARYLATASAGP